MARVLGVEIPDKKPIGVALTYVFGIGRTRAKEICEATNVEPTRRTQELTDDEISAIGAYAERNYSVEGQLRRQITQSISRLVSIHSYRGIRHRRSLPVRGQRTKTNARTRKGRKRTVAGKRGVKETARG